MLLVVLLGVADFGRMFHAGLVTGSAARAALFNLNVSLPMDTGLSLGDVYLRREAFFVVADY